MRPCPCCDPNAPKGGPRLWTLLCERCLHHVTRLQACVHHHERPGPPVRALVVEAS